MAKRYPDELTEAVWAALCAQVPPSEIQRRLAAGELDGYERVLEIPKSSFFSLRARLIARRGQPIAQVKAGQESDVLGETERMALASIAEEVRKLRAKQKRGEELTSPERRDLIALGKAARALRQDGQKRRSQSQRERGQAASTATSGKRQTPIQRLIADSERRFGKHSNGSSDASTHGEHPSEETAATHGHTRATTEPDPSVT